MTIKELQENFNGSGRVTFISVRPERLKPLVVLDHVVAIHQKGLEGDRYASSGSRQVTLIQDEHLKAVSSFLGRDVKPEMVRRNIVVAGINLLALKGKKFKVGEAVLEYSGECHPCSRMETNLGLGGYNAMRGHGGITARIIKSGLIKMGDPVIAVVE
ncbi:MOSC domain-containing protein [Chryseosolibacter indicus]|uniref:MOSC domain-containing protein n=1 Tax=Chryseosolibacter indicus TaxID=2782351 RepID=A0ABS5VNW3_9BACT|nr:MOSC domain-containing protein [Chryseosolibacter indicus]MBT1703123.1 MOSC domain-containing protein [Chryseosolibacter indicus]